MSSHRGCPFCGSDDCAPDITTTAYFSFVAGQVLCAKCQARGPMVYLSSANNKDEAEAAVWAEWDDIHTEYPDDVYVEGD